MTDYKKYINTQSISIMVKLITDNSTLRSEKHGTFGDSSPKKEQLTR